MRSNLAGRPISSVIIILCSKEWKGFIWKLAEAATSKIMRITSPNLNFDHSGKNAYYSVVDFKGP
jgi:hypothetical protein